ncbi:conserved hypothetical protein [Ricinus communis]|uniref:Uncharacterized protein n=1 Tax=Ricinus communis TaxID=3988 RepID=B9SYE8_RICCO|nr:conserved hypothetical protein [Ricinus communis]
MAVSGVKRARITSDVQAPLVHIVALHTGLANESWTHYYSSGQSGMDNLVEQAGIALAVQVFGRAYQSKYRERRNETRVLSRKMRKKMKELRYHIKELIERLKMNWHCINSLKEAKLEREESSNIGLTN